jgi:hypothetical protein
MAVWFYENQKNKKFFHCFKEKTNDRIIIDYITLPAVCQEKSPFDFTRPF